MTSFSTNYSLQIPHKKPSSSPHKARKLVLFPHYPVTTWPHGQKRAWCWPGWLAHERGLEPKRLSPAIASQGGRQPQAGWSRSLHLAPPFGLRRPGSHAPAGRHTQRPATHPTKGPGSWSFFIISNRLPSGGHKISSKLTS